MTPTRRVLPDLPPVRRIRQSSATQIEAGAWPGSVPAVAQLLRCGLDLAPGATVLVGENGSGKSTLLEMLAEAYGLNPQGGSAHALFRTRVSEPGIGSSLILERGVSPRWAYFMRAETMHGLYTYLEQNPGQRSEPRFHELSHGEGFLEILRLRLDGRGFYLLDEPDAPLSFTSALALTAILQQLVGSGSQVVVATHSPLLAALPGASLLEVGEWGLRPTSWERLELVDSWRAFLRDPQEYLHHLAVFEETETP